MTDHEFDCFCRACVASMYDNRDASVAPASTWTSVHSALAVVSVLFAFGLAAMVSLQ